MRVLPRRPAVLWTVAAALALLTAHSVAGQLSELRARTRAVGPPVEVVVAVADLPAGTRLTGTDVRTTLAARSLVPAGALTDPAEAVDGVVSTPLVAGAVVTRRHLADSLAGVVPAGSRAMRVVAERSIRPVAGDVVDVLGAAPAALDVVGDTGAPVTEVVAGLLVLGVDPPSDDLGTDSVGVTVLVDADDAPRLAALVAGPVVLALAPPPAG